MALTANRGGDSYGDGQPKYLSLPVAAATNIFEGSLVCKQSAAIANAVKGSTATGLIAVGVARFQADNSLGAAGAINVEVEAGCFDFDILGGDPVTAADVLNTVYIADDSTIARTDGTGTRSAAGKLVKIENGRAYVFVSGGL